MSEKYPQFQMHYINDGTSEYLPLDHAGAAYSNPFVIAKIGRTVLLDKKAQREK